MRLYGERERHCRMVFEGNYGGVEDRKAILHARMWDVYMNEKKCLLRVVILWECQVLIVIRFFGKCYTIVV